MKYKWIALVLVCALLLCGCRQMGTDISVSDNTTQTGGASDTVATTTTPSVTTTSNTTVTRPSNYTYDADRPRTFLTFSNLEKYTDTVKTFTDKQAIYDHFAAQELKSKKIGDAQLAILLNENYFLVPQLPKGYIYGDVYFSTTGHSAFIIAKESAEDGFLWVEVYHNTQGKQPPDNKDYIFTNMRGVEVARHGYVYVWNEDGTPILVSLQNVKSKDNTTIKSYEELIKTLTFEKVEIK